MKKTIGIIIAIILTLSLCIELVGCAKDDGQAQKLDLTSENYGDYLAVNVEFDTPEIVTVYASTGAVIGYKLYCRGTTIVKRCANVQFEKCSLNIKVIVNGWPSALPTSLGTTIELSYEGEGTGTFTVYDYIAGEKTDINLSVPILKSYTVTEVEGTIIKNS